MKVEDLVAAQPQPADSNLEHGADLLRAELIILLVLAFAAVATGATGVAVLWGAGPTFLFIAACLAAALVVIARGLSRG